MPTVMTGTNGRRESPVSDSTYSFPARWSRTPGTGKTTISRLGSALTFKYSTTDNVSNSASLDIVIASSFTKLEP